MIDAPRSRSWTAYNATQGEEKTRFVALLADLCSGVPQPPRLPGAGRPRLPLSDMVFASVYKVYVGFSSRRFTSDLREAFVNGLVNSTPHFNSVSNYLAKPELADTLKALVAASSLPLKPVETNFAVDSSGFSTSRFVRWYNKKYGRETDNREWIKLHLMCGTQTKIVTSVDVSGWTAHDTNYFVPLLEKTAANFGVEKVSADKAYLSHKNTQAVEEVGATPFIPFKSNSLPPSEDSAWSRMYHYFMFNREEFMAHYHRRSNIESAFSMLKAKFGDSVRSKGDVGQVNEALCKVLCHNICVLVQAIHELGIDPNFCAESRPAQKYPLRACANRECARMDVERARILDHSGSSRSFPVKEPIRARTLTIHQSSPSGNSSLRCCPREKPIIRWAATGLACRTEWSLRS